MEHDVIWTRDFTWICKCGAHGTYDKKGMIAHQAIGNGSVGTSYTKPELIAQGNGNIKCPNA